MAKRRTRKEKIEAKHNVTFSWSPKAKTTTAEANVNRQFATETKSSENASYKLKKAKYLAKDDNLNNTKSNIVRSLATAGFIMGLEIVLYLALSR